MPLSINIGLSRKASRDYQSQGQSINITAELDQALLAKPAELQQQVAALYAQARQALERAAADDAMPASPPPSRGETNGRPRWNGQTSAGRTQPANGGNGRESPAMTASQRRAILAIAERQGVDPQVECADEFGCQIDDLTIRQASAFIDHLKALRGANGSRKAGAR